MSERDDYDEGKRPGPMNWPIVILFSLIMLSGVLFAGWFLLLRLTGVCSKYG